MRPAWGGWGPMAAVTAVTTALAALATRFGLRKGAFGAQEGRLDRRHPAKDDPEEMQRRRRDDGVGGED